jgi:hypothetical protein
MSYKEFLLSDLSSITCCVGGCDYYWSMSAYDLLIFALGSFIVISILLFYYNRIPKSNSPKNELQTPIYQSKDILLQSNSSEINFVIAEKTTSTWVKIFAAIMIIIVAFTPLHELLGTGYFL